MKTDRSKLIIIHKPLAALKANSRNARTHSKPQIRQIAESIRLFGFNNPVLIDKHNRIVAGHGRVAAAKLIGLTEVPTICLEDLTEDQIRAYMLADNKLVENGGWDKSILAIELQHLLNIEPDFDISVTGFEVAEIDLLLCAEATTPDTDDAFETEKNSAPVTQPGDIWILGKHKILCGSATEEDSYSRLMI
jgi:ParB-like chromosome segregation protein Spo0J